MFSKISLRLKSIEGYFYHFVEALLALCGRAFSALLVHGQVGYSADAQCVFAGACGVHIERGSLHFNCQNTHFLPQFKARDILIEGIGRDYIADYRLLARFSRGGHRLFEQGERRYRRKLL